MKRILIVTSPYLRGQKRMDSIPSSANSCDWVDHINLPLQAHWPHQARFALQLVWTMKKGLKTMSNMAKQTVSYMLYQVLLGKPSFWFFLIDFKKPLDSDHWKNFVILVSSNYGHLIATILVPVLGGAGWILWPAVSKTRAKIKDNEKKKPNYCDNCNCVRNDSNHRLFVLYKLPQMGIKPCSIQRLVRPVSCRYC